MLSEANKRMSAPSSPSRPLRFRVVSVALATGLLSGCTMIPKYKRPTPPVATTWPAYQNTSSPKLQQAAYDIGWSDFFTDPRLKALIAIAIRENRDHQRNRRPDVSGPV
jgi:multidrug efflux system outer membrane protein